MKRWKRGIALLAIVAMMMQVLPINVWAEPVADEVTDKTGYLPAGLMEVTLTEEDVADAISLEDQEYRAKTYSASGTDYSSSYYYNQLSYEKRTLYNSMQYECEQYLDTQEDAVVDGSSYARTDYIECTGMSTDDLWEVVWIFTLSNPQYYFIRGTSAFRGYQGSKLYVALAIYPDYQKGYVRAKYTAQFNAKVNNWINEINAESSDYFKIKKAHDIVCANIVYDNDSSNQEKHQSSGTAVLTGNSVCAGYAQLFSLLCNAAGISAICVTSPYHEWNEVKLDNNWYVVDCTWDDSDSDNSWYYNYFCKSDATINEGYHEVESYLSAYRPACNSDYIGKISSYNGNTFYREVDGNIRCYDRNGALVTNKFIFDGSYTYYMQADGTPMKDRLTYHPDGVHIIYFDTDGHEVFSNFQYCPSVGYTCYFDSQGYIYKDQITFVGDKVYYLNANGKMENSGWFRFANGMDYGYANTDGTLKADGFSYDPWGRIVFYHWNGMVARGLITDGVYYYSMDMTDGHYLGSFQ